MLDPTVTLAPTPTVGGEAEQVKTRVLAPTKDAPGRIVRTESD